MTSAHPRIRELARGKSYWTSVDLLTIDRSEIDTICAPLEAMGIQVNVYRAGLAKHVVNVLSGELGSSDYLVIAAQGDDGSIVLPELPDVVAATQRWNRRLSPDDLRAFAKLPGKVVLGTGCDMGDRQLAQVFLDAGCRACIAPLRARFGYVSMLSRYALL